MKRKSIFLGAVISAAMFVGIFINPSLVSTTKNKTSTLTLERIQAYTGEGENSVKCCIGTTLSDITGVGNKCETTDYQRKFLKNENKTEVLLCCKKSTKDDFCWSGVVYFKGNSKSTNWLKGTLTGSAILYHKCNAK